LELLSRLEPKTIGTADESTDTDTDFVQDKQRNSAKRKMERLSLAAKQMDVTPDSPPATQPDESDLSDDLELDGSSVARLSALTAKHDTPFTLVDSKPVLPFFVSMRNNDKVIVEQITSNIEFSGAFRPLLGAYSIVRKANSANWFQESSEISEQHPPRQKNVVFERNCPAR